LSATVALNRVFKGIPAVLDSIRTEVLDRSIVFSFDRSGYERHQRMFRQDDLDVDARGRVCLVTGANSGIGFATAEALARRGASVWLLCRDAGRGRRALRELRLRTGSDALELAQVDVSDLASLRRFADGWGPTPVDVLIHNAGVLPDARQVNSTGIESTLATNVIGPFVLTQLLWARLAASAAARVIFVSSGGMYAQRLDLDDLDWTRRRFDGVAAYAQTKRMQVVLAELLAARAAGTPMTVHAMHPGWADTPAVRTSLPRFHRWMASRLRSPEQGADTVVWLALSARVAAHNGAFWFDRVPQPTHLLPFTREATADRQALWDLCARYVNPPPSRTATGRGARAGRTAT